MAAMVERQRTRRHTRAAEYADGTKKRTIASLRMPKRVCEDWANLLLNDRTTSKSRTLPPPGIFWATDIGE